MVRLLGFNPFRDPLPRPGRANDPASDFSLLQGCGHALCMQPNGCDAASTRQSPGSIGAPIRSWVFGALPTQTCQ
jgi:hypothetical protein